MDLSGKNVVFVGGLGGIGYATSKILMTKKLAYFVVLDLIENEGAIKELQAIDPNSKVIYMKFDITDKEKIHKTIQDVVKEIKYIDVLINGAGIISDRNVELTINVNLVGLINTTLEALPYIDKQRHGRGGLILNIASVAGLEPAGCFAVYAASKFGVVGFTRSLAHQYYYNLTGISVMAVCPGITETPLWKDQVRDRDTFDYSRPMTDRMLSAKSQSPDVLAEHFVQIIEANQNGALWISDMGNLRTIEPPKFWEPTF